MIRSPGPAEAFRCRELTPADVPVWYHVYAPEPFGTTATSFSRGWGDTRFAPLHESDGRPVHTYYAASTRPCTYMESVLHGVALHPPGVFEVVSLARFRLATLRLPPLAYVSFHTPDLPALKLTRAELVDTATDAYPATRRWAQAAYRQRPEAQAIGYGSRRDDAGRCLMLFEQRLPSPPFELLDDEPLDAPALRREVLSLVRSLGLHEI